METPIATGRMLEKIGREYGIRKFKGELEEEYRKRVLIAHRSIVKKLFLKQIELISCEKDGYLIGYKAKHKTLEGFGTSVFEAIGQLVFNNSEDLGIQILIYEEGKK